MFRKTWKQLKILAVLIIVIVCFPRSILPGRGSQQNDDLSFYLKMNNEEKRLAEFSDDEQALKLKIGQLELINKSRKRHNAQPLRLDILASRVANRMSREAAENNYTGHWNLAGEKPYHRYGFAGGNDHVSENAYGEWSSANYDLSAETISSLMKSGHENFMGERAPNDGHKKNTIDKSHNFVGLGYSLQGKQFRYYEEYIDRYFEFEKVPTEAATGEKITVKLKTDGKSFLYFLVAYYEKFPKKLTPREITSKSSYSDFSNEEYVSLPAWELSKYRNGNYYSIPLSFSKEGLYYIQIFTGKKDITRPVSVSTKGLTPYSGIVIKVVNR